MKLSKIEKRLARQTAKVKKIQEKRNELLEEEEQRMQEPSSDKKKKKGRKKDKEKTPEQEVQEIRDSYVRIAPLFHAKRKSLLEWLAPDGVDPNNYGYMKIIDGGKEIYERSYFIDRMPRNAIFAQTFSELFNYKNVTSNILITPLEGEKAISLLDRRIIDLDTELTTAQKNGDRNRGRKVGARMRDAEGWASEIESGNNTFYDVEFLYHTYGQSRDELNAIGSDFHRIGLKNNMNLVSCYGCEPEAYRSGMPVVRMFKSKLGLIRTNTVKKHLMDSYSLATIFNHTKSNFFHKNGVYLGRDLDTGRPVTLDLYDNSLEAHNVIVSGKTGSGKSATVKMLLSRASDFGLKFCSIDSEARGSRGEYSLLTERLGGVNYQISSNSKEIINLYEISEEMEYDESTGEEVVTLHLIDKLAIIKGIMQTMITFGKETPDFSKATAMEGIIDDVNMYLFEIRGIRDGDPDSLYASTAGYQRVKKPLPTISEFYIEVLRRQRENKDPNHVQAYSDLIDSFKTYVRKLHYVSDPGVLKIFTEDEFESLPIGEDGNRYYTTLIDGKEVQKKVTSIRGMRPYYDGQSTIKVDLETPAFNIDVSQLPANDLPIGIAIAANYLNENIVKKNSANPKRIQKRAFLIDEVHRLFRFLGLRVFLSDLYRSARKRFIAPITCTQALADYQGYPETEAIVKQTPIMIMLRQARLDREYLESAIALTPIQMDRMLSLGGRDQEDGTVAEKGQICLIVNDRATFVQVDYLRDSETEVVETNMQVIHEHVRKRRSEEYAKQHSA